MFDETDRLIALKFPVLDKDNIILYASKCYDPIEPSHYREFLSDFMRYKYVRQLLTKYKKDKVLNERLVLNHIITMNNVFGTLATARILYFDLPSELLSIMKTFLSFLGVCPKVICGVPEDINLDSVPLDTTIKQRLERL